MACYFVFGIEIENIVDYYKGVLMKRRILFLTTQFPYPLDNGGKIRAFNNLRALSRECELDLVCFSEAIISEEHLDVVKEYCSEIKIFQKVFSNSKSKTMVIRNVLKGIIKNTPFIIEKFNDKKCMNHLNYLNNKYDYDEVFFEHLQISGYHKVFNKATKCVLSQQNCEHVLLYRRYIESKNPLKRLYTLLEYKKLKSYELKVCAEFDRVIMLSEEDRQFLYDAGYKGKKPSILPIGVCVDEYKYIDRPAVNTNNILFMGTMSWYPNEQGIEWFLDNVWDKLREKNKDLKLYVVGKDPSKDILRKNNINGVVVTGYVADMKEYIEKCEICIIPLFIGGGMRVKILESMARKIPCVSTSVGAEGIDIINNKNIVIANNEGEFISSIIKLHEDINFRKEIIKNAYSLVSKKYSEEAIQKKLIEII